jgi:hypothetical protein
MEFNLSDEQKKLVKRAALLAKSYKPKRPEINLRFQVEQGGGLEPDWQGSACNIYTESGDKDIDYDQFYDLIFEFVEDNLGEFFKPFNQQDDESWGAIWCEFNYEKKTLTFGHDVSYYESNFSAEEGKVKQELAQRLINVKNDSDDLQGDIISMSFNGGGDSGYIENGENELGESVDIPSSFEDFGYDILEKNFGGWELNEGSYGNIQLDFSEPGEVSWTIEMNMNGEEGFSDTYDFEVKLDY